MGSSVLFRASSRKQLSALLLFALLFVSPAQGQDPIPQQYRAAIERIDAMTAAELAKDNLGSVTIGVVAGPKLIWTKSYGYADIETKKPATRNTVYRIASITKQFTATMLLQLVEQGKVRLSDPVEKYVPEINQAKNRYPNAPPITLLQLATMTSGLAAEPDEQARFVVGPVSDWEKTLLSALPYARYQYEPGTRYLYCNIGYATLGLASSRVASQRFVDYVRERIFTPLGMTHSDFEPTDRVRPNLATGYSALEGGKVDANTIEQQRVGRGYKVPNGAMYTTVDDLARFVSLELGDGPETVLKKQTLEDNYSRVSSSSMVPFNDAMGRHGIFTYGYGVGFNVERRGELIAYGHLGGGANGGYQTGGGGPASMGFGAAARFDRASRTGVIVLRNVGGGKFEVFDLPLRALAVLAGDGKSN